MPTFHHKSRSHLSACNALGSPETWFGFLLDKQQVVKHWLTSPRLKGSNGDAVYSGSHVHCDRCQASRLRVFCLLCRGPVALPQAHKVRSSSNSDGISVFFRKSGVHKILSDTDAQIVESEVRYFGELD